MRVEFGEVSLGWQASLVELSVGDPIDVPPAEIRMHGQNRHLISRRLDLVVATNPTLWTFRIALMFPYLLSSSRGHKEIILFSSLQTHTLRGSAQKLCGDDIA